MQGHKPCLNTVKMTTRLGLSISFLPRSPCQVRMSIPGHESGQDPWIVSPDKHTSYSRTLPRNIDTAARLVHTSTMNDFVRLANSSGWILNHILYPICNIYNITYNYHSVSRHSLSSLPPSNPFPLQHHHLVPSISSSPSSYKP